MCSTIYTIAQKTGYSASTVARVLRDSGYASEKAKKVIWAAATELNYAPSYAAKVMRTQKTHRILFCVPAMDSQFYRCISQQICSFMESHGYLCLMTIVGSNNEKQLSMVRSLNGDIADGMIMVSYNVTRELCDAINEVNKPVVLINYVAEKKPSDRFHNVYTDVTDGIFQTTSHLIEHGHRDIALLTGSIETSTTQTRYAGYAKALSSFGIQFKETFVFCEDKFDSIEDACRAIVNCTPRPTAVVCCADYEALCVLSYCHSHGLRVPEDISITGMNDDSFSALTDPPITSFSLKDATLGYEAARICYDSLNAQTDYQTVCLKGNLLVRGTVASIN